MHQPIRSVILLVCLLSAGCHEQTRSTSASETKPAPSPSAAAKASPGISPGTVSGAQPAVPSSIPERLRHPLTREEIEKLPPDVRDMILRAQGRASATPATPKPSSTATPKP